MPKPNKSATASLPLQLGQNDIPAPGRYAMKSVLEKGAVRMSFGISAMIMLWGSWIQWDPFCLGGIKQAANVWSFYVILQDFPYKSVLIRLVSYFPYPCRVGLGWR